MKSFISVSCKGETCAMPLRDGSPCGDSAEFKVEETVFPDDPEPMRHPYVAYICRFHFARIMGPACVEPHYVSSDCPLWYDGCNCCLPDSYIG